MGGWDDITGMQFNKRGQRFLRLLEIQCKNEGNTNDDILAQKKIFLGTDKFNLKDVVRR